MGEGRVKVSYELLADVLRLPEYTTILMLRDDNPKLQFEIKLCHADLPRVPKGEWVPSYTPQY